MVVTKSIVWDQDIMWDAQEFVLAKIVTIIIAIVVSISKNTMFTDVQHVIKSCATVVVVRELAKAHSTALCVLTPHKLAPKLNTSVSRSYSF